MIQEKRFLEILSNFKSINPVMVIGDVGIDKYTYGDVSRISPEAPVPILEVSKEWYKLGLAANVSDNLQSLGVPSTLCGVIGNDAFGNMFEDILEEQGIKTWGIVRAANRTTTVKERVTTNSQQICRIDYETKTPIDQDSLNKLFNRGKEFSLSHSCLIIEDYGKGIFSKDFLQRLISEFKEQNKFIAVDPSRSTDPHWYEGATLLKPNRVESELMAEALGYREKNVEVIANLLVEKLKLKKIIITLGGEGMAMLDQELDGRFHLIPTLATEVFDVSGAGDTAISAITAALAAGANLEEAAWIGNCASGVVVGKKGTALVDQNELKGFYQNLKQKIQ